MHDATSQVAIAAVATWAINWLKTAGWAKFITPESSTKVQRAVSALIALATAAGISFAWDSTAGVLTISGLHAANAAHLVWDAFQQYVLQHTLYHATKP